MLARRGLVEKREPELKRLLEERNRFLQELSDVREQVLERRKAQLSAINKNLAATIKDYSVNLYYDPVGIIDEFKQFVLNVMHMHLISRGCRRGFLSSNHTTESSVSDCQGGREASRRNFRNRTSLGNTDLPTICSSR